MSTGWNESADVWIADNATDGDFSRQHVVGRFGDDARVLKVAAWIQECIF
ncbi:MAG: hypothetical protein RIG26_03905 [Thalassospira sp.]